MPRAILALRRYPATMLLAALLFAASLIMAATSLGTVIGGGEGDDGGSGIGGTGKSGEFGGSGFGGTGGPSPFFTGAADQDEQSDQQQPLAPVVDTPTIEQTVRIELARSLADEPLDDTGVGVENSATLIAEPAVQEPAMQIELARAPVLERQTAPQTLNESAPEPVVATPIDRVATADAIAQAATPSEPAIELISDSHTAPVVQAVAVLAETAAETVDAAAMPPETVAVAQEAEQEVSEAPLDRSSVPERIQRPDLPPFQRIRPVERPSLLPSRVQPMRI